MNEFGSIPVGSVRGALPALLYPAKRTAPQVAIRYPSRLEAMALDPSKVAYDPDSLYTAGQIDFCIDICKTVTVAHLPHSEGTIAISRNSPRPSLVRHATMIALQLLGVSEGISVDVVNELELRHCGLGSSSSLIAAVVSAIHELYGAPVSRPDLIRFLARNHGEEIDSDDARVNPVQCLGGSAACGLTQGSAIVVAGKATVIAAQNLDKSLKVIIGIPREFTFPDSEYLLRMEEENMPNFIACGEKYGPEIAYDMLHAVLPALQSGDLGPAGDLIYRYRFQMGSIRNCSFVYPPIVEISQKIAFLKEKGHAEILSLSSVGPGFFAITHEPEICISAFEEQSMDVYVTSLHNSPYVVL
jgi:predicted sugar kinase